MWCFEFMIIYGTYTVLELQFHFWIKAFTTFSTQLGSEPISVKFCLQIFPYVSSICLIPLYSTYYLLASTASAFCFIHYLLILPHVLPISFFIWCLSLWFVCFYPFWSFLSLSIPNIDLSISLDALFNLTSIDLVFIIPHP